MRHPRVRALAVGVVTFAVTTVAFLVASAQLSSWRKPPLLAPLAPQRIGAPAAVAAQPTTRTDVQLVTTDASLRAVVTAPSSASDVAVVLVSGAGPADRLTLLPLARRLAESGIAVLTYDKRADGYSPFHRDYLQLANDASAAIDLLRASTGASRVGVLGFSEGGWVTSVVAGRADSPVDFVVLVSAPVVSPLEQSSWIVDAALRDAPLPLRRVAATALAQGRTVIDYLDFDTRPFLNRIHVPVLAFWGADDATVPVNAAYRRLRTTLPTTLTAHIVPGAGHELDSGSKEWIARAASWMHAASGPALTGSEPSRHTGVATPPAPHLLGDVRLHLATSLSIALLTAGTYRLRRRNRKKNQ